MLNYDRCPNDDMKIGTGVIGTNPKTGKPIELTVNELSAVASVHAAMLSITVAMRSGAEEDFIEKIALALSSRIAEDPHSLCPFSNLIAAMTALATGIGKVSFSKEGHVVIAPEGINLDDWEKGCPLERFLGNQEDSEDQPDLRLSDPDDDDDEGEGEGLEGSIS